MTGSTPSRPRRGRRGTVRFLGVAAVCLAAASLLPAAAPAHAAPEPPCAAGWGSCDTRATDRGYVYTFTGGRFRRTSPLAPDVAAATPCPGCPPPFNPCELGTGVFPGMPVRPAWCDNPPDAAPTLADVQAALTNYLREKDLPRPTLVVQPSGRSFTNLPAILHTPAPPSYTFNVDQPVLATISAVPHYRWDFGDGTIGPDSPGRPYDPGISPREHPASYVSHVYKQPGTYTVTLTVTWQGTFAVPGVGQAFPLNPVALAVNAPLAVDEAGGVLTGSG